MGKDFGIDQFGPDLADPLGALIEKLHISQGLNKSGEIAFAFFDPESARVKKTENMLTLFPVTDYRAFLGNLKDVKEDGDVAEGESRGKHWYVAHWGDYAAMSLAKSLVATKPVEKMKLSELAAKESNTKDAVIIANMEAIRTFVLPEMRANHKDILDALTKNVEQNEATKKYAPIARAVERFLEDLETFISDANAVILSLQLGDDGIGTTLLNEFQPDSDSATTVADLKGEPAPMARSWLDCPIANTTPSAVMPLIPWRCSGSLRWSLIRSSSNSLIPATRGSKRQICSKRSKLCRALAARLAEPWFPRGPLIRRVSFRSSVLAVEMRRK